MQGKTISVKAKQGKGRHLQEFQAELFQEILGKLIPGKAIPGKKISGKLR